jgi:hypothetical protein
MLTHRLIPTITLALALSASLGTVGSAVAAEADQQSQYLLSLQFEGATPQWPEDYSELHDLAARIVESSNDNSRDPKWNWDLAARLAEYRRAANGRYLLISYSVPRTIRTPGGDVIVKEILIGLNGSQYASSLHTVDDEGRIVGHAMYSGMLCIKLQELVVSMKRRLTTRSSGP